MWVRGLKRVNRDRKPKPSEVAPFVGAWIETIRLGESFFQTTVAPFVGAWIETIEEDTEEQFEKSHPLWVRGLKLFPPSIFRRLLSRTLCGCVD